jgi:hypothetical protein
MREMALQGSAISRRELLRLADQWDKMVDQLKRLAKM